MKVIIFGGDGYLGWPTAMHLSKNNIEVYCVDNFSKRKIELENGIKPLFNIETMQNRVKIWNKKANALKKIKKFY
jgi:UDP-sulfoquinovose synthase